MINRRQMLMSGGGLVALLPLFPSIVTAQNVVEITMGGKDMGAKVWFDPIGILIEPGQTIRWTNKDEGNAHTATAYHPDNYDRPQRIPKGAKAFDSDFLLPGESFSVTLTEPGIYDYYCIPHEHAGMVGRIIVKGLGPDALASAMDDGDLPEAALQAFPAVADIMAKGAVHVNLS